MLNRWKSITPSQGATLFVGVAVVGLLLNAYARQVEPNFRCVQNTRAISRAALLYLQDYDERFPPAFRTTAQLEFYTRPLLNTDAFFVCPDTNKGYLPNAALEGKAITAFDSETTFLVRDVAAHSDGQSTRGYLDLRILHGGKYTDTTVQCMANMRNVTTGMVMYVQDWDQMLPPMTHTTDFNTAVYPYVRAHWKFSCPDTARAYTPNARLSGQTLPPDPQFTIVLQDAVPHADGNTSIAYLDQHVAHGKLTLNGDPYDKTSPDFDCISNVHQINLGMMMYIQDYDETFPPMQSNARMQAAINPYIRSDIYSCPVTGSPYKPNSALSYVPLANIVSPPTTVTLQDAKAHPDRTSVYGYADGHVQRH